MLCALLARDVLVLRAVLVAAQGILAAYALSIGVIAIAGWNAVFVLINVVWVAVIVHERRAVQVPLHLAPIHQRHFAAMQPREFLAWWQRGRRELVQDVPLTRAGQHPATLDFIVSGMVRISRDGTVVAELARGSFVGEMSLVTGLPANADADAIGSAELQRWPRAELDGLRERDLTMWTKIQSAIGADLVDKIRRGDERTKP
jgi:CRP-like cAMP-binding protein